MYERYLSTSKPMHKVRQSLIVEFAAFSLRIFWLGYLSNLRVRQNLANGKNVPGTIDCR